MIYNLPLISNSNSKNRINWKEKKRKEFFTTKMLIWKQVKWSEYLSQFNLVIKFYSSHLGTKPDTFTRQ